MTVFAVIPTHNRRDRLQQCLEYLYAQTEPVVVAIGDGGSSDGTADMVLSRFPQAIFCRGSEDDWWSASINMAIRAVLDRCARTDFVLCMNDDTEVSADYVSRLLGVAQPDLLIGSVAVDARSPNVIIDGGCSMNWLTAAFRNANRGRTLSEFAPGYLRAVDVLPGRGTLIPAAVFLDLGLFAERELPHYGADYEFSARCALAGYRLAVSYDAVVKSITETTGIHGFSEGFSWGRLRRIAFDRRSNTNIGDRFRFAWLTRRNPLQALIFFAFSIFRIAGHHALGLMGPGSPPAHSRRSSVEHS